jgi:hypothetical protein
MNGLTARALKAAHNRVGGRCDGLRSQAVRLRTRRPHATHVPASKDRFARVFGSHTAAKVAMAVTLSVNGTATERGFF